MEPEIVDPNNTNIVTKTVYINGATSVAVYSAPWCKSCNRIKEHFPELFKDYVLSSTSYLVKADYKTDINNLIPFFIKHGREIDRLQTSDPIVLKQFLEL